MPRIEYDFDEGRKADLVPEGRYPGRIEKITEGMSQQDNPKWALQVALTSEDAHNKRVFANLVLTPQSMWRVRQLAEAVGISTKGKKSIDSEELLGREVGVAIAHRIFEGELRMEISSFFRLGS